LYPRFSGKPWSFRFLFRSHGPNPQNDMSRGKELRSGEKASQQVSEGVLANGFGTDEYLMPSEGGARKSPVRELRKEISAGLQRMVNLDILVGSSVACLRIDTTILRGFN